MKGREKRHKRSASRVLNIINRTPAPIAVLVGIFLGLVIARLWFGPVRIFVYLVVASLAAPYGDILGNFFMPLALASLHEKLPRGLQHTRALDPRALCERGNSHSQANNNDAVFSSYSHISANIIQNNARVTPNPCIKLKLENATKSFLAARLRLKPSHGSDTGAPQMNWVLHPGCMKISRQPAPIKSGKMQREITSISSQSTCTTHSR